MSTGLSVVWAPRHPGARARQTAPPRGAGAGFATSPCPRSQILRRCRATSLIDRA